MRIFVAGANGGVGRAVVTTALQYGHFATASRPPPSPAAPSYRRSSKAPSPTSRTRSSAHWPGTTPSSAPSATRRSSSPPRSTWSPACAPSTCHGSRCRRPGAPAPHAPSNAREQEAASPAYRHHRSQFRHRSRRSQTAAPSRARGDRGRPRPARTRQIAGEHHTADFARLTTIRTLVAHLEGPIDFLAASSRSHRTVTIDACLAEGRQGLSPHHAYARAQLAAGSLLCEYGCRHPGIDVGDFHPGIIASDSGRYLGPAGRILMLAAWPILASRHQGAGRLADLALATTLLGGAYTSPGRPGSPTSTTRSSARCCGTWPKH